MLLCISIGLPHCDCHDGGNTSECGRGITLQANGLIQLPKLANAVYVNGVNDILIIWSWLNAISLGVHG